MNRAYKLVWNTISNSWVVASELAKSGKKSSGRTLKLAALMAAGLTAGMANAAPAANQLPTGGSPFLGSTTIDSSVANQITVNQTTVGSLISWQTFNVGKDAKVIFNQPSANSYTFNSVSNGSPSEIMGQVQANGHFILSNPSGVVFGAGSQVNAAAIVATTNPWNSIYFQENSYAVDASSATGIVENHGTLTATGGSVTLLAAHVINTGTISAIGGNVNLLNAGSVGFINSIPTTISASSQLGVIQNTGSIQATQVSTVGGRIILTGDTSQATSKISLGGSLQAEDAIVATGKTIAIDSALSSNGNTSLTADDNININADLTVGSNNTLALVHGSDSGEGYFLDRGARVNLSGASSGFSVNGNAYTVIDDVNELQAISSNVGGRYVLGTNIDASATAIWNSGAGFVPVSSFSGTLDGLGHEVSQLFIYRPSEIYVGLFGSTRDATLQNIGLVNVNVTGSSYTGALVGDVMGNGGSSLLNRVYASGQVNGGINGGYVGGLIGIAETLSGNSNITIRNSYSSVNVTANNRVGGLIGWLGTLNSSTNVLLENSYASGSVTGNSFVGGLAGRVYTNVSSGASLNINNSYSSGTVSGSSNVGGLLGDLYGSPVSIQNSYWNIGSSGQSNGVGTISSGSPVVNQVNGLTSTQATQLSSYANWGSTIDAQAGTGSIWRIYEGQTAPLLRTFLKALDVSVNNADGSKTYDGTTTTINADYSLLDAQADGSKVKVGGLAVRNAGTYNYSSSLYSVQDGYDLSVVDDATFTINKKQLTITAQADSKVYDGKLTSSTTAKPVVAGRQRGDAIVGLTQSYLDKNAGTGKTVVVDGGYSIRDGNNGNNYDVVIVNSTAGVITPKALTISTIANSKVYDGGLTSANKPLVTGLITGDRVTGLFQQYETKTIGENKKLLIKNGYVVQDGNSGGNYVVTEQGSNNGVISAH